MKSFLLRRTGELLKQLPGYEGYDERPEILHFIKPGTGCKDSPCAFSLKLAWYYRGLNT